MGLCYFLNMSLSEGFWQPHRTPFIDYLQCFNLQPTTSENSWKESLPWLFTCKDPGVSLLINILVILTQNLIFQ